MFDKEYSEDEVDRLEDEVDRLEDEVEALEGQIERLSKKEGWLEQIAAAYCAECILFATCSTRSTKTHPLVHTGCISKTSFLEPLKSEL